MLPYVPSECMVKLVASAEDTTELTDVWEIAVQPDQGGELWPVNHLPEAAVLDATTGTPRCP